MRLHLVGTHEIKGALDAEMRLWYNAPETLEALPG